MVKNKKSKGRRYGGIVLMFELLFSFQIYSQNLVKNPSFEEYGECPDRINQLERCNDWFGTGNGSSPDYFNSCSKYNAYIGYSVGVPKNIAGHQIARTGVGYSGIVLLYSTKYGKKDDSFLYREYIQGNLEYSLKKNDIIEFEFYISLAESSCFSSDRISVCFSSTKNLPSLIPYSALKCETKVTVKEIDFKNSNDWVQVKGMYHASGGEKYLTIGIFADDISKKEWLELENNNAIQGVTKSSSYYYIDDVSVSIIDFAHQ
jgi:OmpA-OmpF porin, OOP family